MEAMAKGKTAIHTRLEGVVVGGERKISEKVISDSKGEGLDSGGGEKEDIGNEFLGITRKGGMGS